MNFLYLLISLCLFVFLFYSGAYKNVFYMFAILSICVLLFALGTASQEGHAELKFLIALLRKDNPEIISIAMQGLEKNWTSLRFFTAGTFSALQIYELDKAEALANRAFQIAPKHPETALALFLLKLHLHQFDEAEIWAPHVKLKDPNMKVFVYFARYRQYSLKEDFDKAAENLDLLEKLDNKYFPEYRTKSCRVSLLLSTKKLTEALALSRRNHDEWIHKLPVMEGAVLDQNLGDAMMANLMWRPAAETYSRALQNNPDLLFSLVQRAACYCALREFEKAKSDLDEFDSRNKDEDLTHHSQAIRKLLED